MKYLITLFYIISSTLIFGQIIDVTERTIKIGGGKEEEMYYGFEEGDKIIFSLEEINGKEVKEIEIIEYPEQSRFADFKTAKISGKNLQVSKRSAYIFRIKNGAINGRICKITIQRIPANESTKSFNTNVGWENKQETTYNTYTKNVIVGYDTTYMPKTRRVLISTEQKENMILDKVQRVHSQLNENGNKSVISFTLPEYQKTEYSSTKVISWAYWVGVGEESNRAWQSNSKTISGLAKSAATYFTTPLGAVAVGAAVELMLPKNGEDVAYSLTDYTNAGLFLRNYQYQGYDHGKGVASYKKIDQFALLQGSYSICLLNDNTMTPIDVNVKVVVIEEIKTYKDEQYTEPLISPRYEKKTFSDPIVKTYRVPVIGN